jgi:hypothetical protein
MGWGAAVISLCEKYFHIEQIYLSRRIRPFIRKIAFFIERKTPFPRSGKLSAHQSGIGGRDSDPAISDFAFSDFAFGEVR